ncbi:hypothetical protein BX666DRAFT_1904439 [Dichotomocladium elegans]|nr:hypothetical protein BX666DRAFT_1904439 [Dichotomocladium elegans]
MSYADDGFLTSVLISGKPGAWKRRLIASLTEPYFLEGTVRDPSLKAHVILDSDEEEVDERFNLPSRSIAEEFVSQKQQDQDSPNRDFPTPKDTDSIPLRDGDDAIPLLLTGPHSSLPSKRHRRHGSPSTALSSTSLSKELSTSPPPYSPHSHIDTTYSHVENISSLPIQHSKPVSRPVSSGKSLDMPNSDALQPLDSSRHTPMATVASQGTSIFNPIDIDDEDDVQKCNITSGVIPASPKMNTTMHGNVQESSFDHIMCHSAASFTALDFLKEWEYSNSDNDNESDSNIAKALAEKNNMDDQELSNLERQKAKRVEKQREIKERKQQEKEVKQRRKEELKAEKEKQRQLEQANRVRNNRQELYSEMILDVDRDFYASSRGELLRQAIAAKEAELRQVNTMYCTITWHRKTRAAWNEKEGTFIPYPDNEVRIVQESKVLVFMDIEEICEFVQSPDREDRIDRIKRACDGRQVLLMIEGLDGYYKRKNLLQQRNFEQSVIQSLSGEGSTTTHSMRGPKRKHDALTLMAETGPTRMQIEESLTYFQLVKDIMLVPTTDEADSVDWIMALTADIASAIYK